MFARIEPFFRHSALKSVKRCVWVIILLLTTQFNVFSNALPTDSLNMVEDVPMFPDSLSIKGDFERETILLDSIAEDVNKEILQMNLATTDSIAIDDEWVEREVEYAPDPNTAVWMSAIFPGLGQVYNRRYWKLPIIVGGYLGLGYATSWNNGMLKDYTKAYADLTDNDPTTKSYMDFFPSSIKEESLDKTWLENILKSRKNYYRRNRDLCIICMVGVYLLSMVDAYVDASLSHFDISPDLSIDVTPAIIQDTRGKLPSVGLNWAINF